MQGWVRTNRNSKAVGFIALNDGTTFSNVQVVYGENLENFDEVSKITTGSAMEVTGKLVCTPDAKQPFEIQAENICVLGLCDHDYPYKRNVTALNLCVKFLMYVLVQIHIMRCLD